MLEINATEFGEQAAGASVHIPNSKVFTDPVANLTQGFSYVWNEIPITITFESDWKRAKQLLQPLLKENTGAVSEDAARYIRSASKRFLIHSAGVGPAAYTRIVDDGVELTMRYVCEARSRRTSRETVCETVLDAFASEPRSDFAYRTSRLFRQTDEGKRALRTQSVNPEGPNLPEQPSS